MDNLKPVLDVLLTLGEGFLQTLTLFGLTILFAVPLGLIVSLGSMCKFKPLAYVVKGIVWIIRGTPLMLQIIIVFYFVFPSFSSPTERMISAVVTFSINYAAYFSEIFRGGIEGIPKGQYEACHVLGISKAQCFARIILPQAIKRIVPPMGNEIITLVKDTALANVIGVVDIIKASDEFISRAMIWPLLVSGIFYLVFNGLLTVLFAVLEKKLAYYR